MLFILSTKSSFSFQFYLKVKIDEEHEFKYKVYQIRTSVNILKLITLISTVQLLRLSKIQPS